MSPIFPQRRVLCRSLTLRVPVRNQQQSQVFYVAACSAPLAENISVGLIRYGLEDFLFFSCMGTPKDQNTIIPFASDYFFSLTPPVMNLIHPLFSPYSSNASISLCISLLTSHPAFLWVFFSKPRISFGKP
jgi:hypothetical protein